VEATVIESYIKVYDVAVYEFSLIWDTVTNNLVDGSAYRLGEVYIVQRGWVRLRRNS